MELMVARDASYAVLVVSMHKLALRIGRLQTPVPLS